MHTSMSKRLLAGLLSVVMVLSLFATVPTAANKAEAASSWSLTGKTSVESLTTNSYVIKGLKTTQYAKVSVSGTAKAGVTVKKGSATVKSTTKIAGTGKNITLNVRNANVPGKTYTLTVKVYGKKSGKLFKTLKKTVSIYKKTTDLAVAPKTTTLKVGETAQLTTVVKPSTSTQAVKFASLNENVATVDANGVITAVAVGATSIKVTSGSKVEFVDVIVAETVADAASVAKVELRLAETIEGKEHTLLVTQEASVIATALDKDGNKVVGAQIYLNVKNDSNNGINGDVELVGNGVATTNEKGEATFILAHDTNGATIFDTTFVGRATFTATVLGNSTIKNEGVVDFAAISYGSVNVKNGTADQKINPVAPYAVPALVAGTNATLVGQAAGATTYSVNKTTPNVDYVTSQQVSNKGKANHTVYFNTNPALVLPAPVDASQVTKEFEQKVDFKSGKYGTHADKGTIVPIDVDTTKLDYATLHINNIQISKYTKLVISSYATAVNAAYGVGAIDVKEIHGEKEQSSFGYQIPVSTTVKYIRVEVISAGQVNTGKNNGFELSKITGMYKTQTAGAVVELQNAVKVEWAKADSVLYSEDKNFIADGHQAKLPAGVYNASHKYVYQVPTFPQVGNAIIREYDANNKLIAYYACPTVNKQFGGVAQNENVIAPAGKAFLVTKDEATNLTGTIEAHDNYVYVNSELVGTTPIVGKVAMANASDGDKAVENAKIYTSVQWSPLPTAAAPGAAATPSTPLFALRGQTVEIEAQIVDANGNKVSQSGVSLTFKYGAHDAAHAATAIAAGATLDTVNDSVKCTSAVTSTDYNGVAKIKVQAGNVDVLEDITATTAANYNVVLKVAGVETTKADIYWLDANLTFTPAVINNPEGLASTPQVDPLQTVNPFAGETWEYAFNATGAAVLGCGVLAGFRVDLSGIDLNFKLNGMKDTVVMNKIASDAVTLTSKKAGLTKLVASIDANGLGNNVTATATLLALGIKLECAFVGTGATNIDKSVTLPINWKTTGLNASWVTPSNSKAQVGVNHNLFLKVTDANGYPVSGKKVDYSYKTTTGQVVTTSDGIAKIPVTAPGAEESIIVTATVEGMEGQTFNTTLNFKTAVANAGLALVQAVYNVGTPDKIELTFNKDVDEKSVNAKEFVVEKLDGAGASLNPAVKYAVNAAEVNGNKVTLTLAGNNVVQGVSTQLKVSIRTATVDSVEYTIKAEDGHALNATYNNIIFTSDCDETLTIADAGVGNNVTVTTTANATAYVYFVDDNGAVTRVQCAGYTKATALAAGHYYVYTGNVMKEIDKL